MTNNAAGDAAGDQEHEMSGGAILRKLPDATSTISTTTRGEAHTGGNHDDEGGEWHGGFEPALRRAKLTVVARAGDKAADDAAEQGSGFEPRRACKRRNHRG